MDIVAGSNQSDNCSQSQGYVNKTIRPEAKNSPSMPPEPLLFVNHRDRPKQSQFDV